MSEPTHMDAEVRRSALDPTRSFIVQAPAGSGKTELLIQRYLVLLARVDAPEEVLAITFTRKAAAEMRDRIVDALAAAEADPPAEGHRRTTWDQARRVLVRDRAQGWNLRTHPLRMRIQTIDSLCMTLTRQMPWLSRFGAQPVVLEQAEPLYREAARATLQHLETAEGWSEAVARLLVHLDGDLTRIEGLLVDMLGRRDQWLRHLVGYRGAGGRGALEVALGEVVCEGLAAVRDAVPPPVRATLLELLRFAAHNLRDADSLSPIRACLDLCDLPGIEPEDQSAWLGVAELLLTKDDTWRRQVSASLGFPAPSSTRDKAAKALYEARKEALKGLLADLADAEPLRLRLGAARRLPPARYTDEQWGLLAALTELLPLAAAELRLVFKAHGRVDFIEVSQSAIQALGEPEQPTDLALALDYRIQHVLVDEFQDTSHSQYHLLERLTAGWETGDGRSLFVVGDPMQSIYRFREAEVGLFLRSRRTGVGALRLTPLTLECNFRSCAPIVEWVNGTFPRVMPRLEEPSIGAVTYSPSVAARPAEPDAGVRLFPAFADDPEAEARQVVELIRQTQDRDPKGTIAVLVRSRGHLTAIVPALFRANLPFEAVDVEALGARPAVQDLLSLTKALAHPADRLAWLAVLRAPWCGLTLADLYQLGGDDHWAPIPAVIDAKDPWPDLSLDGRMRLGRVWPHLQGALADRRRGPLRHQVESVWTALGGPATVDGRGLEEAGVFLELLERFEREADLDSLAELDRRVAELFAPPAVDADGRLQIMTIHRAKGLEFDTVIVPGLGKRAAGDPSRLLVWMERTGSAPGSGLLLGPIRATGEERDPVYDYLRRVDQERARHEDGRLIYVAATRARRCLYLLGHTGVGDGEDGCVPRKPAPGSLLAQLWDVVAEDFHQAWGRSAPTDETLIPGDPPPRPLRRLTTGWTLPDPAAGVRVAATTRTELESQIEFVWAGDIARHVGTVVHRHLQAIGEDGLEAWDAHEVDRRVPAYRASLRRLGVLADQLDEAVTRVREALQATLADPRGRWILATHREARCEYALTGVVGGELIHAVLDRTFVDADGVRWIIDYKTSSHEGGDVTTFLAREAERYREQLRLYATLMGGLETRPVRLGLYFPLLRGWREVEP